MTILFSLVVLVVAGIFAWTEPDVLYVANCK